MSMHNPPRPGPAGHHLDPLQPSHDHRSHLPSHLESQLLTIRRNLQELIAIGEQMRAMNHHNMTHSHMPDHMSNYPSFLHALEHNAVKLSSLMQQLPASVLKNHVVLPFDINGVHHGGRGVRADWLLTCAEPKLRDERAEMVNAGRVELLQALAKRDEVNASASTAVGGMGRPAVKRRLGLTAALGSSSAPGSSLGEAAAQVAPERSDQELLERMQARVTFHDRIVNAAETYVRDSFVAKEHKLFQPYAESGRPDDFDEIEVGVTMASQSTFQRPSRPARATQVAPTVDSGALGSSGKGVEKMDAGRMKKLTGIVESMVRR